MSFHARAIEGAPIELKDADPADEAGIVTKALDRLEANIEGRLAAIEQKAADTTRLDRLEARLNRPGTVAPKAVEENTAELETKAWATYLRTGRIDSAALETKALTLGSSSGTVLAPPTVDTNVLEKIVEFSPIRSIASKVQMGGPLLEMLRLRDEVEPGMVSEIGPRPEDEPTFDSIDLKPFEAAVIVPLSKTILEDSAVNLSAFLSQHLAKKFGQKEGRQFVIGNGTTEAEGVLTSPDVKALTTAAAALKGDDLIDAFYGIQTFYSGRGAWLMNRATMALVRKLKNAQDEYLWQPGLQAGQPPSILGRPVYEAPDMPNVAAGATPIVFGDFASGYLIADRVGLETRVDELTGWGNGIVRLLARRRYGGRVVEGDALVKLKLKA